MADSRFNLKLSPEYQKRMKIIRNHLAVRYSIATLSLPRAAEMCIEAMEQSLGITPPATQDKENK